MESRRDWMPPAQIADPIAAAATVILLTVASLIFLWWRHPLYGKNRGPVIYPIVGMLPSVMKNRERLFDWMTEHLKKTPTHTMRMVRPGGVVVFSTANVANVEHILRTRFENFPKGEALSEVLGDLLGKGIFNTDGDLWKLQRKLASYEFTTRSLREFVVECAQREVEERLVPVLCKVADDGAVVDLQDLFLRFSFDNICQLGFGVDPKCLDPSLPDVRFAEAFDMATECTARRFGMFPYTRRAIQLLGTGTEKKLKESLVVINEFAAGVIQARRKEFDDDDGSADAAGRRQDLLSRFMRFSHASDGDAAARSELEQKCWNDLKLHANPRNKEQAPDVFLRDMVISFVLAGRDTTSAALAWFFWLLSLHPGVESKIHDEIEAHLRTRPRDAADAADVQAAPPNPPPRAAAAFSFEELKNLQYLHAALHESLRLYPPVPVDTKFTAHDDTLPDGTFLRKGDRISYNIYAMARMEDIWGPDCGEFRPERWIKAGVFVPESPFKFAVFQAGPRICLGKDMALIQMKLIAATLLHNFSLTVVRGHNPQYNRSLTMRMLHGLPVTVRRRAAL